MRNCESTREGASYGLLLFSPRSIIFGMNCVLNCLLSLAIGLSGQAVHENDADSAAIGKLTSALMALNEARASQASVSEQVVEGMMLLAENDERPLRLVVERFADGLIRELVGKHLNSDQITAVRQCIVEVMRRTGASNLNLATRLQETLTSIGVTSWKKKLIVKDFIKVGEAVRGPDDLSNKPVPPMPR
jgi:hypothetical protein